MTKSKLTVKIIDCTTGEEIIRDLTAEEITQFELNAEKAKAERAQAQEKELQRQAILDRLGLTADEAKLILG
jgi:hypothetical protein